MLVRLLGPVRVATGESWVKAGPPKQSCVLAALVLARGRPLTNEVLIHRVWGDRAPASARGVVYKHVARLRDLLGPAANLSRGGPDGYVLQVADDQVDVFRARGLTDRARAAADRGDHGAAVELWREAGGLWNGPALSGVDGPWARRVRQGLDGEHVEALVGRFDAELALGRHVEVGAELDEAVTRHPLEENLVAQLMLALYRADRPADALGRYGELRERVREALGNEPTPRLTRLHRQILRQDPELAAPSPARAPAANVPAQLPADVATFTGRADLVDQLVRGARPGAASAAVTAMDGMAGVGKTALAIHAATRLRGEFPDGQLFLDLHGFSPDVPPLPPGEALDRLLRGLGYTGASIPDNVDERAALFRSAIADKRVLIVLDNAADEDQVCPLLPAAAESRLLITSRRRLVGLDDARLVSLDVLTLGEAIDLFDRVAGRESAGDLAAVADVVELCGRLPLAVRMAAARLKSRRHWTVERLRDRLADLTRTLSELELGSRGVGAAFEVSLREVPAPQRDVLLRLGLVPGPDFDAAAVAALTGMSRVDAEDVLERLADTHIVEPAAADRYRFHDLLRLFVRQRARDDLSGARIEAATTRLYSYYLHSAHHAAEFEPLHRVRRVLPASAAGVEPFRPGDADAADGWFESEMDNLAAAVTAADPSRDATVHLLADAMHGRLLRRAEFDAMDQIGRSGLDAALRLGDPQAEAAMRVMLGHLAESRGEVTAAVGEFATALRLLGDGDELGRVPFVLGTIGGTLIRAGRLGEAAEYTRLALERHRRDGDPTDVASSLNGLGLICLDNGRLDEAIGCFDEAARIYVAELGHPTETILCNLALAHAAAGNLDRALECATRGLKLSRGRDNVHSDMSIIDTKARVHIARGEPEAALELAERAVALARGVGSPIPLAYCTATLASVPRTDPHRTIDLAERALSAALAHGLHTIEVDMLTVLAAAHHRAGHLAQARRQAERAANLARARELAVLETKARGVLNELHAATTEHAARSGDGPPGGATVAR